MSINLQNQQAYWSIGLTLTISFIIFLLFSLVQTIILFLFIPEGQSNVDAQSIAYIHLGTIASISSFIGLLLVLLFVKIKNNRIKNYLDIYIPSIKYFIIFLSLSFCLMFLIEKISNLYPQVFENNFVFDSYSQANSLPVFYLGVVFLGPIFEEFLFRGFLFKGLEKSFLGGHGAVFISAILFAIIHVQYGFFIILFMLFPLALLLGYAKLKSGTILLPICIHILNNFITCLITHWEIY